MAKSRASLSVEEQVSSSENSLFLQPIYQFLRVRELDQTVVFVSVRIKKKGGVAETRSNGEEEEEERENEKKLYFGCCVTCAA